MDFADRLHEGLVNAQISVSGGGDWLRRGKKIGRDRVRTIKNSKILIPILSRDYASGRCCLDELVQIMECKNDGSGHIVLSIFYGVEPARVGCQIDGSGQKDVEERKRRAHTEVCSLKGWESEKVANGDEGRLVELVVRKVLIELKKAFDLVITENSAGIKSPLERILEFVDSRCSTLYVVIHGEGGVGKTTLAKVIYNKLSERFDHHSFIPNISESCKCNGIEYLQSQLILDISKGKTKVYDKDQLITTISSSFKRKKVLILLDDVNAKDQLEALAGERNWFAPGSRIIVTTREESVLDWANVDCVHLHEEMDEDEAKILFARHTF